MKCRKRSIQVPLSTVISYNIYLYYIYLILQKYIKVNKVQKSQNINNRTA